MRMILEGPGLGPGPSGTWGMGWGQAPHHPNHPRLLQILPTGNCRFGLGFSSFLVQISDQIDYVFYLYVEYRKIWQKTNCRVCKSISTEFEELERPKVL